MKNNLRKKKMSERPLLSQIKDGKTLREYYFLKEELVCFCRENGLPTTGGKLELTERIAVFLDAGEIKRASSAEAPSFLQRANRKELFV